MAALLEISIKNANNEWEKFTIQIKDETDQYGNNVAMYKAQTKEQREAKEKREYVANGKVFWNDGKIINATKIDKKDNF